MGLRDTSSKITSFGLATKKVVKSRRSKGNVIFFPIFRLKSFLFQGVFLIWIQFVLNHFQLFVLAATLEKIYRRLFYDAFPVIRKNLAELYERICWMFSKIYDKHGRKVNWHLRNNLLNIGISFDDLVFFNMIVKLWARYKGTCSFFLRNEEGTKINFFQMLRGRNGRTKVKERKKEQFCSFFSLISRGIFIKM